MFKREIRIDALDDRMVCRGCRRITESESDEDIKTFKFNKKTKVMSFVCSSCRDNVLEHDKSAFSWLEGNLRFTTVLNELFGHACGYVRFRRRPLKQKGYNGILSYVPVHGGITFAEKDQDGMVYGFDTNHAGDDERRAELNSPEFLKKECENLAFCIQRAAKYEKKYLRKRGNRGRSKVLDKYHKELRKKGIRFELTNNWSAMINVLCGKL